MFKKIVCVALFAASFTACKEDKKPASAADALKDQVPPSLTLDTTTAAERDMTLAVSDKELEAAKLNSEKESAAAKKAAAKAAAAEAAAQKKAADAAKKAEKPKPKPAPAKPAPTKPVLVPAKPDAKGSKPTTKPTTSLPAGDVIKKRTGKDDVFVRSEIVPAYPGGDAAMIKYLQKNVRYPAVARENGVQGTVMVQFVVEKDGKVDDIVVVRSVDKSLDAEAKRVVAAMPKWTPGQQNGTPVAVQYVLPVKFNLSE